MVSLRRVRDLLRRQRLYSPIWTKSQKIKTKKYELRVDNQVRCQGLYPHRIRNSSSSENHIESFGQRDPLMT